MDRNSAIGLFLIGGLLLLYFNFFSPTPAPIDQKPAQLSATESRANALASAVKTKAQEIQALAQVELDN